MDAALKEAEARHHESTQTDTRLDHQSLDDFMDEILRADPTVGRLLASVEEASPSGVTTGRLLSVEPSPSPSPLPSPSPDDDNAGCLLTVVDGWAGRA